MAEQTGELEELSKQYPNKNAVTLFEEAKYISLGHIYK